MEEPLPQLIEPERSRRAHKRTRMFISVTLSSASCTSKVRVRDISASGSLVEAEELPAVGERIKLRHHDCVASGVVVRRERTQAGIHFDRPINPVGWLPNKSHSQLMVDTAFQTIKPIFEGGPPKENSPEVGRSEPLALPSSPATRDELEGIADMLDALADQMSEDPDIISNYFDKLQVLDIASQKLRKAGRNCNPSE